MSLAEIKRKISSVSATEKITNAMNLVATAKLRKQKMLYSQIDDFYHGYYNVFGYVLSRTNYAIQYNYDNEAPSIWIVITSKMGLCGAYNHNVIKLAQQSIKKGDALSLYGKKAIEFWRDNNKLDNEIIDRIDDNDQLFGYEQAYVYAKELLNKMATTQYKNIKIIYTQFINGLTFEPSIINLLPIDERLIEQWNEWLDKKKIAIEFEPSEHKIVDDMLPNYIANVIYGAMLESKVSENASRRNAMDSATQNAQDLKQDYILKYNRKRQATITNEIIEVVSSSED